MKTRTVGVSPKLVAAVVTAVVTYIAGQELVDLEPWVEMILQGVLVALAVYSVGPGTVVAEPDDRAGERGYSLVEVLAALFLGLLVVIVLLALLDRL